MFSSPFGSGQNIRRKNKSSQAIVLHEGVDAMRHNLIAGGPISLLLVGFHLIFYTTLPSIKFAAA